MAHNIKNHAEQLKARSALLASFGLGAGKFYKTEAEADEFAISLVSSTEYNLAGATDLLGHFSGFSILYMSPTHPSFGRRMAIVRDAISKLSKPSFELTTLSPDLAHFQLGGASAFGGALKNLGASPKAECPGLTYRNMSISLNLKRSPTMKMLQAAPSPSLTLEPKLNRMALDLSTIDRLRQTQTAYLSLLVWTREFKTPEPRKEN